MMSLEKDNMSEGNNPGGPEDRDAPLGETQSDRVRTATAVLENAARQGQAQSEMSPDEALRVISEAMGKTGPQNINQGDELNSRSTMEWILKNVPGAREEVARLVRSGREGEAVGSFERDLSELPSDIRARV